MSSSISRVARPRSRPMLFWVLSQMIRMRMRKTIEVAVDAAEEEAEEVAIAMREEKLKPIKLRIRKELILVTTLVTNTVSA